MSGMVGYLCLTVSTEEKIIRANYVLHFLCKIRSFNLYFYFQRKMKKSQETYTHFDANAKILQQGNSKLVCVN